MDPISGVGLLKTAIDGLNGLRELSKQYEDIELKQKIIQLYNQMIDIRVAYEESIQEIKKLQEEARFKGTIKMEKGVLWVDSDPVPFCPPCWELRKLTVHLIVGSRSGWQPVKCPNCSFGTSMNPDYKLPENPNTSRW